MGPVFASADIAALVAAFPPPSPKARQPSLVRSLSGNSLLKSQTVISRFRKLLENSARRIRKQDLPSRLGVEKVDWLLNPHAGQIQIHWSRDSQSIIPSQAFEEICTNLYHQTKSNFIDLQDFATKSDIALVELEESHEFQGWLERFSSSAKGGVTYVGKTSLVERAKGELCALMSSSQSDKVLLGQHFPGIPKAVLEDLASHVVAEFGALESSDEEVVFVPKGYHTTQQSKDREAYEAKLQTVSQDLRLDGFCYLNDKEAAREKLRQDVSSQYHQIHPDLPGLTLVVANGSEILIVEESLNQTLQELVNSAMALAPKIRRGECTINDQDIENFLANSSSQPKIASIIFSTKYRGAVDDAVLSAIVELDNSDRCRFENLFQLQILAPIQMYASGIESVQDTTLKQHLEEYLGEHFRREVVPQWINAIEKQGIVLNRVVRDKDVEKLRQSIDDAKLMSAVQALLTKFARKQKVTGPSTDQILRAKLDDLRHKLGATKKTDRGSDVLQNLIWILLAREVRDTLFMSSGKHTSRMIKHYQLVGNAETGRKLEQWRDLLKASNESADDLSEMRVLAEEAVANMAGEETEEQP